MLVKAPITPSSSIGHSSSPSAPSFPVSKPIRIDITVQHASGTPEPITYTMKYGKTFEKLMKLYKDEIKRSVDFFHNDTLLSSTMTPANAHMLPTMEGEEFIVVAKPSDRKRILSSSSSSSSSSSLLDKKKLSENASASSLSSSKTSSLSLVPSHSLASLPSSSSSSSSLPKSSKSSQPSSFVSSRSSASVSLSYSSASSASSLTSSSTSSSPLTSSSSSSSSLGLPSLIGQLNSKAFYEGLVADSREVTRDIHCGSCLSIRVNVLSLLSLL
jgi:hypothetical protein